MNATRAITGPAHVPAPETPAQRLKMLSRTPGALLTVTSDHTLVVICDDAEARARVTHRLQTAASMTRRTILITEGPLFQLNVVMS